MVAGLNAAFQTLNPLGVHVLNTRERKRYEELCRLLRELAVEIKSEMPYDELTTDEIVRLSINSEV
jgi:hypothetical protein